MNKLKISLFAVVIAAMSMLASCGGKDPDPDIRDQAVGNYDFELKSYILYSSLVPDPDGDDAGTLVVTKSTSESNTLNIQIKDVDDPVSFKGNNIQAVANGFTFDVVEFNSYGQLIQPYKTYPGNSGVMYSGFYNNATKKMFIGIKAVVDGDVYVAKITGNKL